MNQRSILLFDGVCNLCNSSVQWILKIDKKEQFLFASLQSETGQNLLKKYNLPSKELKSVVLIHQEKAYLRSDVPLEVARLLGRGWHLFYVFRIIPKNWRDGVYDWIAAHRYKWFGQKNECWLPTPDLKRRFL